MFDITIIGAGVTGCAIARELSKYKLKICVLEKEIDVACGTSKANSGIVHAGEDPIPGTLKAKLNVRANKMYDKLKEELDFPFKRNESLVLCFDENDIDKLEALRQRGIKNGIPDTMEVLNREEALKLEPNLADGVVAVLRLPTGGIVCPYEFTIALAENAYMNGVEFKFETEVQEIEKLEDEYRLKTNKGTIQTKLVINAAGVHADEFNNMVSNKKIKIIPRKGEYCLFDKSAGNLISRTLFQLPTKMGKGVLVTPTVDGNLLIGPSSVDIDNKENVNTTREGIDSILEKSKKSVKGVPMRQVITSFTGLRAHEVDSDFIIGEVEDANNFINAAGIESPGLTSAPAIGEMVADIVVEKLSPEKNEKFNPIRKDIPKFREMNNEERRKLIQENADYGKIVCRCETVTEGEILNAIRRPLGARTLDGVKRRTRAGMGRCQSGFCSNRIVELLARELNIPRTEVTKYGRKSNVLTGKIKEDIK
ncbi:NAD(P)/FAD-dependent oxidoreductase [Clostridium aestuarii]|uniref:NAD(P)/FAD-dependent oxidoreductase n=1 Tax=Clostridium aestuarii TaxID=338193 RepID=A0ABT4CWC8_9CLOT|nr:NAD(P)/FAD-dependent oxidoreductase [Clostridium aestuarii]MCY6483271.1 NAD(P)/FAD-dependent oxidoreductase [Clostridium aestuarii]